MADIKTKDSMHTVKTFDRVQNLAAKTRNGASETKQKVSETISSGESSESEYAGNQLESYEGGTARLALYAGDKVGRWGVRETRRNIQKWRNRKNKLEIKVDFPRVNELPAPNQPKLLEAPKVTGNTASKTAAQITKTSAKTAKGSIKTASNGVKNTAKIVKTSAKTAEKTVKATEKSAQATAKAAKAAAKAAKAAVQATVKFVKAAVKAIVAATKAVVAAIKGIAAAIAAGGWVAVVVILVIVVIGGIVAAVCGIFTPNDSGGCSVAYMVSVCDSEYDRQEAEIISNSEYDYLVVEGREASMKDVIAVFAVLTNTESKDFSKVDDELQDEFRTVFNAMNSIEVYSTTSEETVIKEYTDENGNPYTIEETVEKATLHILHHSKTASQGADYFKFTDKQREQLDTLMSSDFDELWAALVE